ncbi:MAG: hypothetical protein KA785_05665 [Spirochaetaceae bacterium]|nr:hypothetical protein [Spirochaetaceae bacterium]
MFNVNQKNTVYFGTHIKNLEALINGITTPLIRDEKYISVSVSGYCSVIPVTSHEELSFLAGMYVSTYKAAVLNEHNCMQWKRGYKNSLTYIDGFGPNEHETYHEFGKMLKNNRKGTNICAVIKGSKADIITLDKSAVSEFEFLSQALHPYIREISIPMIEGFIVDQYNYDDVESLLIKRSIDKKIWKVEEIE